MIVNENKYTTKALFSAPVATTKAKNIEISASAKVLCK
jgi:hypothetical protein